MHILFKTTRVSHKLDSRPEFTIESLILDLGQNHDLGRKNVR